MQTRRNLFLDAIGRRFNEQRPNVPEGLNYTTHIENGAGGSFYNINLRSRGCRHNAQGGCTMCDYWVSRGLDPSRTVDFAREAIESLKTIPGLLCMGPYGSMFDDWELPPKEREEIYRLMLSVNSPYYEVFSRCDTVTEDKVQQLLRFFDPARISIDMGLETADSWKLKYCINKALEQEDFIKAVDVLRSHGLFSTAFILLGVPFLTPSEMVEDTIASVNWALDHGVGYAVVFPVHVKPWTVVRWLYEHGLYEPVSLWALVEVLVRLPSESLRRVGLSWHNPRPERTHPLSPVSTIVPYTCPQCYERVVSILESYRFSEDRAKTVATVNSIECECRSAWQKNQAAGPTGSLSERVKNMYEQMGVEILGKDWWTYHGAEVLASIPDHA